VTLLSHPPMMCHLTDGIGIQLRFRGHCDHPRSSRGEAQSLDPRHMLMVLDLGLYQLSSIALSHRRQVLPNQRDNSKKESSAHCSSLANWSETMATSSQRSESIIHVGHGIAIDGRHPRKGRYRTGVDVYGELIGSCGGVCGSWVDWTDRPGLLLRDATLSSSASKSSWKS
jgi:hypothetical protein